MRSCFTLACALALTLAALAAPAFAADRDEPEAPGNGVPTDAWELSIAPYLWGIGLDGSVSAEGVETDFDIDFSEIWDALEFAALAAVDARHGRLSLSGNVTYMKLAPEADGATGAALPGAPPGAFHVDAVLDSLIVEGVVGWEVARSPLFGDGSDGRQIALELRGGFRAWWTENYLDVELDPGSPLGPFRRELEESDGWVDPVVGARLRAHPTEKLGLVVSGDVGGFDVGSCSKLTWSVAAFATYQASEHWQLGAGWRGIDVDRGASDLWTSGPLLGGVYRF